MTNLTLTNPLHEGVTVEEHVPIEEAAPGSKDSWNFGNARGAPVDVYECDGTHAGVGRMPPRCDYRGPKGQVRYVLAGGAKAKQNPDGLGVVLLTPQELAEEG